MEEVKQKILEQKEESNLLKEEIAEIVAHSCEALISPNATAQSTENATEALKLAMDYSMKYIRREKDACEQIIKASRLAGKAISVTGFTAAEGIANVLMEKYSISYAYAKAVAVPGVIEILLHHIERKYSVNAIVDGKFAKKDNITQNVDFVEIAPEDNNIAIALKNLMSVLSLGEWNLSTIRDQIVFINDICGICEPDHIDDKECSLLAEKVMAYGTYSNHIACTLQNLKIALYEIFHLMTVEEFEYRLVPGRVTDKKLKMDVKSHMKSDYRPQSILYDPKRKNYKERQEFVKGLQELVLETLLLSAEFFDKNNLRYYLAEGTLLGAVRHNGFIPWDDDVDVVMPRDDYDRLVELAQEGKIPPEIHFDSLETNKKHHWVLGAKMQLTRKTEYIQHKVTNLSEYNGPYIDIFPLDYWDSEFNMKQRRAYRNVRLARRMLFINTGYSRSLIRKGKIKPHRIVMNILSLIVKNERIVDFALKNMKKFNDGSRKFMINLCSYYHFEKETFSAGAFGEPVYIDFEGHKLPVPKEYDYMLKTIYGMKYDTIPPVKVTRMRQHTFEKKEQ